MPTWVDKITYGCWADDGFLYAGRASTHAGSGCNKDATDKLGLCAKHRLEIVGNVGGHG